MSKTCAQHATRLSRRYGLVDSTAQYFLLVEIRQMRRAVRLFIHHVKRHYTMGCDVNQQTEFLRWLNTEMEVRLGAESDSEGSTTESLPKRQRVE